MKLNFQEFKEYVKANIMTELPKEYEGAEVQIHAVTKNNGIALDGLSIHRKDTAISPTIYLNEMYEAYQASGDLDRTLTKLADIYQDAMYQTPKGMTFDINEGLLAGKARDLITFRVCGYEANEEQLQSMPHERMGDMAITYHIIATQSEDGIGSIRLTNSLMQEMGLKESELKDLALANTVRMYPPTMKSMMEVMEEMMMGRAVESGDMGRELPEDNMYVLSNTSGINGASTLFYPKMQEQIAEILGNNYYVLPSSVHEVLIVPDNGQMSQKELAEMVKEVNDTQVPANEVLTYNVYHYDRQERALTSYLKPSERQKEQKQSLRENLQKAKKRQSMEVTTSKPDRVKQGMER